MPMRFISFMAWSTIGCSLFTGCCSEKYDTSDLNGVYSSMTSNLSMRDSSGCDSIDHMILFCDRRGRVSGRIAWVTDDDAASTGDGHVDGRFEEVSGWFDTKTGAFQLRDTSVYGDIDGNLLEHRKVELLESGSEAGSPGAG